MTHEDARCFLNDTLKEIVKNRLAPDGIVLHDHINEGFFSISKGQSIVSFMTFGKISGMILNDSFTVQARISRNGVIIDNVEYCEPKDLYYARCYIKLWLQTHRWLWED